MQFPSRKLKKLPRYSCYAFICRSMKTLFQCCHCGVGVGGDGPATRRAEGEPRRPLDSTEIDPGE